MKGTLIHLSIILLLLIVLPSACHRGDSEAKTFSKTGLSQHLNFGSGYSHAEKKCCNFELKACQGCGRVSWSQHSSLLSPAKINSEIIALGLLTLLTTLFKLSLTKLVSRPHKNLPPAACNSLLFQKTAFLC